jgi:hypothetical protein
MIVACGSPAIGCLLTKKQRRTGDLNEAFAAVEIVSRKPVPLSQSSELVAEADGKDRKERGVTQVMVIARYEGIQIVLESGVLVD